MINQEYSKEDLLRKTLNLEGESGRKNYSVMAGAGAGKTTMLSTRICHQILEGIDIESFLIITYTNVAAAEIQNKISQRLSEMISSGNLSKCEKDRADYAIKHIEMMQISTIHSFLFKVLKENAIEANLALDVTQIEEEEDRKRQVEFFYRWYQDERNHEKVAEALKDTDKFETYQSQVISSLFYQIANVREDVIVFDEDTINHSMEEYAKVFVNRWYGLMEQLYGAIKNHLPLTAKKVPISNGKDPYKTFQSDWPLIKDLRDREDYLNCALKISKVVEKTVRNISENGTFYKKSGKVDYTSYEEALKDDMRDMGLLKTVEENKSVIDYNFVEYHEKAEKAKIGNRIAILAKEIQKSYQNEINHQGLILSNDDILYRAEVQLKTNRVLLDRLRNRYQKIYVDEFQDTTRLQTRIVLALSEKEGTPYKDDDFVDGTVNDRNFETDKLIFVGDPKQSIYRFTGAEKAIFDTMHQRYGHYPIEVAQPVELMRNFRSNQSIIDWVNHSYEQLMTEYSSMTTNWNIQDTNTIYGVFRHEKDEADFQSVATIIKRMVQNPNYLIETRSENPEEGMISRTIHYGDILVITEDTSHLSPYVKVCQEMEIPFVFVAKHSVGGNIVLDQYLAMYDYFTNPKDKKKKYLALQAYTGLDVASLTVEEVRAWSEKLQKEYQKTVDLDAAGLAQYLFMHEELYYPKNIAVPEYVSHSANARIHLLMESSSQKAVGNRKAFMKNMLQMVEDKQKQEPLLEQNMDAVRFMNVHQSKGLTSPIVIIADRSRTEKTYYSGFKHAGKYYPDFGYSVEKLKISYPAYGHDVELLRLDEKEEKEEKIRLEYVAATRAANILIILPNTKPVPKSGVKPKVWFDEPEYQWSQLKEITDTLDSRDQKQIPVKDSLSNHKNDSSAYTIQDLSELLQNTAIEKRNSVQTINVSPSSFELKGTSGYTVKQEGYVRESRPRGNVFGVVMHRCFELIVNAFDTLSSMEEETRKQTIIKMIHRSVLESLKDFRRDDSKEDYVTYLSHTLPGYFDTVLKPILKTKNSDQIFTEYAFSFYVPKEDRSWFIETFGKYLSKHDTSTEVEEEQETDDEESSYEEELKEMSGNTISSDQFDGKEIWINGIADLVIQQNDGSVIIYDYKSDTRNGKEMNQFTESLGKKYEGQLKLYQYAISKAFHISMDQVNADAKTNLIHLYLDETNSES